LHSEVFPAPQRPERLYDVNVRADNLKPPINTFTGNRKNLQINNGEALQHVRPLLKHKDKEFFCEHNTFTECVFVAELCSDAGTLV
jgi:hypothetical protein